MIGLRKDQPLLLDTEDQEVNMKLLQLYEQQEMKIVEDIESTSNLSSL